MLAYVDFSVNNFFNFFQIIFALSRKALKIILLVFVVAVCDSSVNIHHGYDKSQHIFSFFYPIIFLNILYSLTETFLCTLYKLIYNILKIPIPGGLYVNRKKKYAITSTHNPKQNVYKCILQDRVNL